MQLHYFPSPAETNTLGTASLRERFLIGGLLLGIIVGMWELAKTVWHR